MVDGRLLVGSQPTSNDACEAAVIPRWYYSSNTGLQSQSVIYTQKTPESAATVLLDPNTFSTDGTVALNDFAFSWDGSLVAYSIARCGGE